MTKSPLTETCRLCHKQRKLCRSHIIPEFCYKSLYDEKHRAIAINPKDSTDTGYIQKGLRSNILCEDCEQLINDNYEKPFKQYWYDRDVLGQLEAGPDSILLTNIPYGPFKLFHLSIMFRASVSDHFNFGEIRLGPHEDAIRRMLLDNEPLDDQTYPIMCGAVEGKKGEIWTDLIGPGRRLRAEFGHRTYLVTFAGAQWFYFITSHQSQAIRREMCLQSDGRMPVVKLPWKELDHPDHKRGKRSK